MASQSRDLLGRELRAHHIALCINRKERFVLSGIVRCTSGGPVHRYGLAQRTLLSPSMVIIARHVVLKHMIDLLRGKSSALNLRSLMG